MQVVERWILLSFNGIMTLARLSAPLFCLQESGTKSTHAHTISPAVRLCGAYFQRKLHHAGEALIEHSLIGISSPPDHNDSYTNESCQERD